ncbi:hypothetical protein QBC40DRAFT_267314 [Triangularia verruculosa]|uniref:Uncharacterized protein n=1 Tax=Triangularia verruculosa TaxID=2587418 RepID=A0AAN7ATB5_9PEZI|nr:hypothetical protein QBC40DRAFT_267314 [Triangularia verruculosa]
MAIVSCQCSNCRNTLGEFENYCRRIEIEPAAFSPATEGEQWDLAAHAKEGGLVVAGGLHLEKLFCNGCNQHIGYQCSWTPVGHAITVNQVILYISNVGLFSHDGKKTEPALCLSPLGLDNVPVPVPDINAPLDAPLHLADEAMNPWGLHAPISEADENACAVSYAQDIVNIRADIEQLRSELDLMRTTGGGLPSKGLDILTRNVVEIGNRVQQVENVHIEFELWKAGVDVAMAEQKTDCHTGLLPHTETRVPSHHSSNPFITGDNTVSSTRPAGPEYGQETLA